MSNSELHETIFQWGALNGYYIIIEGEFYRIISSIFLHNSPMHIVMNMLSLYMVGRMVEKIFGVGAYLGLYFVSAFIGSFASIYMHPVGWAVGASGAIFGIFGALAGLAFVHRGRMQREFMEFMRSFGIVLVINFFIGLIFPNIDMSAHVGGLIAGVFGGFLIAKNLAYLKFYLLFGGVIILGCYSYFPSLYMNYLPL